MIYLSNKDRKKWRETVEKFNKARNTYARTHKNSKYYIPAKIVYEEVGTTKYSSRKDFNNMIKSLERATRNGAFDLVQTKGGELATRWELNEASIKRRALSIQQTNKIKAIKKKFKNKKKQKSSIDYLKGNITIPTKKISELKLGELNSFMKALANSQEDLSNMWILDAQYRANYYSALARNGIQQDSEIYKILEKLSDEEIAVGMYTDPFLAIDTPYLEEHVKETEEKLVNHWGRYAKSK